MASNFLRRNITQELCYLKNVDWYRSQYTLKNDLKYDKKPLEVLFKSKHFLIVNKPFDLLMYNYNKHTKSMPTLIELLKEQFPVLYDPRLVGGFHILHRLDSVTSGCVCFPLNYFSFRYAFDAFKRHQAEKYYLALVYGKVDPNLEIPGVINSAETVNEFKINIPIGENRHEFGYSRCTVIDRFENKLDCVLPENALTKVKILEYGKYNGKDCTKLLIQPITGRRHQIRVHLKYIGYPIVGDMCYGIGDYDTYRTMLHSYKIQIKINTKERMFIKRQGTRSFHKLS